MRGSNVSFIFSTNPSAKETVPYTYEDVRQRQANVCDTTGSVVKCVKMFHSGHSGHVSKGMIQHMDVQQGPRSRKNMKRSRSITNFIYLS